MTEEQKLESQSKRREKIDLIAKLSRKNDEVSWRTIAILKVKLVQKEWDELLSSNLMTKEAAYKCINELKMLKKTKYARKDGVMPRKHRFEGTPVETLGLTFEKELQVFLNSKQQQLKVLEQHGFIFQPFWRNMNMVGSRKKKPVEPTILVHGSEVQEN